MKELLEDLKAVLEKHQALIQLEEIDEGFFELTVETLNDIQVLDTGYRDLYVTPDTLEINLKTYGLPD